MTGFIYPPYEDLCKCAVEYPEAVIILLMLWNDSDASFKVKWARCTVAQLNCHMPIQHMNEMGFLDFEIKRNVYHIQLKKPEKSQCT